MNHIYNVDWHATDRCNLNCASCGHFSCLVDQNDNSSDRTCQQAEEDLFELYRVSNNGEYIDHLTITGGECTLNKDLPEILEIANKYFPNKISIYTNVINKNLYTNELMKTLETLNITFECTLYYNKSIDIFNELQNKYQNIKFVRYGLYEYDAENYFCNCFFTKDRIKNIDDGICNSKYLCCQLKDKKIYPCQYCGYINYFFTKFGAYYKDILEYNEDEASINLQEIDSYEELYEYLFSFDFKNKFCKHCIDKWKKSLPEYGDEIGRTKHHISNKTIDEYVTENVEDVLYKSYCNNVLTKKFSINTY